MSLLKALQQILNNLGFQTSVATFLALFGLAFVRLLTAIFLSPFLGGGVVSARVKVGLAVIIVAILFPGFSSSPGARELTTLIFLGLLLKEAMIGATLGLVTQLFFFAVQMAGTLIDTQRGMNQATFFSPQLPGNASILGQLKFQAALALFLAIDGHLAFIRALHASFEDVPLLAFPQISGGLQAMMEQLIHLSSGILATAVQLAAPALLALFLVDVAFATLGKVVPQIHLHFESQTVKSLVGLALVFLAIGLVMDQVQGHLLRMIREVASLSKRFG
jgi:flagellar biosynthetic protein FliR